MIFEQKNVEEEPDLIPSNVQILHPKQTRKYVLIYFFYFSTLLIIVRSEF